MTDIDPTQMKQMAFGTPKQAQPPANGTAKPNEDQNSTDAGSAQGGAQAATVPSKGSSKGAAARPTKPAKAAPATTKPRKRSDRVEEPDMSVATAIAQGLSKEKVDDLLDQWKKYRRQQANDEAKAAADLLQAQVDSARRKIADELLRLADGYGCSMEEAKAIYAEALAAKFSDKVKGK